MASTSVCLPVVGFLIGVAIIGSVVGATYFVSLPLSARMKEMDGAISKMDSGIETLTSQLRSDSEQIAVLTHRVDSLQDQLNNMIRRIEPLDRFEITNARSEWRCPWNIDTYRNLWMGEIAPGTNPYYGWSITLTVKNTGLLDSEIDNIFLDGKFLTSSLSAYPDTYVEVWWEDVGRYNASTANNVVSSLPIGAGQIARIRLLLPRGLLSSGQIVTVSLVTTIGHAYSKSMTLP